MNFSQFSSALLSVLLWSHSCVFRQCRAAIIPNHSVPPVQTPVRQMSAPLISSSFDIEPSTTYAASPSPPALPTSLSSRPSAESTPLSIPQHPEGPPNPRGGIPILAVVILSVSVVVVIGVSIGAFLYLRRMRHSKQSRTPASKRSDLSAGGHSDYLHQNNLLYVTRPSGSSAHQCAPVSPTSIHTLNAPDGTFLPSKPSASPAHIHKFSMHSLDVPRHDHDLPKDIPSSPRISGDMGLEGALSDADIKMVALALGARRSSEPRPWTPRNQPVSDVNSVISLPIMPNVARFIGDALHTPRGLTPPPRPPNSWQHDSKIRPASTVLPASSPTSPKDKGRLWMASLSPDHLSTFASRRISS